MSEPRVPTVDDFGAWQFAEPVLEGLFRIIDRDLMTALNIPPIYTQQRPDPCGAITEKVPLILAEDREQVVPYVILNFERLTFADYESPKRLTETLKFFLEVYVLDDPSPCGVLRGLRIIAALLRVLFRVKSRDFWLAENPHVGVDAVITVRDVKRMPASADTTGRTRGLTQPYRIEFDVKLTEVSDKR